MIDQLPTTDLRHDLLRACLAQLGQHYEGGDVNRACTEALWRELALPLDHLGLFSPDLFRRQHYERARLAFSELLALGLYYENHDGEPHTAEAVYANQSWHIFMEQIKQPDLTDQQRRFVHIDAMMSGLLHWLINTPGGLAEAIRDLSTAMEGDSP